MRVLGVIPARLGSTRLPNKPLQLLAGEPLITRVIQRVLEHGLVDELVVATDSPMVVEVVERAEVRALVTGGGHASGTDRVAEVAARPEFAAFDVIANVQGDEPFLAREALAGALDRIAKGDDVGTAAGPLDPALADDPSRVKVVTDERGRALYFSRAAIPFRREPGDPAEGLYWQHVGIYAYTRPALRRWVAEPPSRAEQAERLEQLRALHCGLRIGVARLDAPVLPGVDTLDDLRRAEAHWHALQGVGL
jgi:3-deoxy-manno-octulosonate cytidylyltransferase (CMP-KDO synthetase)